MKKYLYYYATFFLFFLSFQSQATHVRGGQMEFEQQGKDTFLIRLTMYRDCTGIPYATPITATIDAIPAVGGCNGLSASLSIVSCKDITNLCPSACRPCSPTSCNSTVNLCSAPITYFGIEKVVYEGTFIFPSNMSSTCCYFRASYSICCRNSNVTTGSAGETEFLFTEFNRCLKPFISSPKFITDPVTLMNRGKCQTLDLSVQTDNVHDSVSYTLGKAYNTMYADLITYNSPNSYLYPLSGFVPSAAQGGNVAKPWLRVSGQACSGFFLDSVNGELTFKPSKIEQGPICVDAKIWRYDSASKKMKQIGLIRRDVHIIIEDSAANTLPAISVPYSVHICAGDTFKLENKTIIDKDSVTVGNGKVMRDSLSLTYQGELTGANFTQTQSGKSVTWSVIWPTNNMLASTIPYSFNITANDNYCSIPGFAARNVLVYVDYKPVATSKITVDTNCYTVHLQATPDTTQPRYKNYKYTWTVGQNIYVAKDTIVPIPTGKQVIMLTVSLTGCDLVTYDTVTAPNHFYITADSEATYCKYANKTFHMKSHYNKGFVTYYVNNTTLGQVDSFSTTIYADTVFNIKAQDSAGCMSYQQLKIHSRSPYVKLGSDIYACNQDTVTLDAGDNQGKGITLYDWRNLANPNTTLFTTRKAYVIDSTTFFVKVTDSSSCYESDTITVNRIYAKPNAGADIHFCAGTPVTLSATGANSYDWYFAKPGVFYKNGSSILYNRDSSTSLAVIGVVQSNGLTCSGYDTVNIFREPTPIVNLGNDTSICENNFNLTLDAGAGNYTYLWEDSSTQETHQVTTGGQKWVKVTSSYQCVGFDLINISSLPAPKVNLGVDTVVCSNQAFAINLNATNPGNNTYQWNNSTTNATYTATSAGLYWVKVTGANGCEETDSIQVSQSQAPTIFLGNDTTINQGDSLLLDGGAGMKTYIWNTGKTSQKIYAKDSGYYSATVTNQAGCSASDSIFIHVAIKNGIGQLEEEVLFTIYPNPASKNLYIDCSNKNLAPKYCELYNMEGKLVKKLSGQGGDISNLANGVYLLHIYTGNGVVVKKVEIKQ